MKETWKTKRIQDAVWAKTSGRCWYCGEETSVRRGIGGMSSASEFCIDHVVPQSMGGGHELNNLVPCCRSCNSSKGGRSLEEFRVFVSWTREFGFHIPMRMRERLLTIGVNLPTPEKTYGFYFEREALC